MKPLDKILALVCLLAGISVIIVVPAVYAIYGVSLVLAPGIYLWMTRSKKEVTLDFHISNRERIYKILNILFFIALGYSIWALHSVLYGRPHGYSLPTIFMACLIPLIILTSPRRSRYQLLTLGEILILSLSLRLSVFYASSGFMWDLWRHKDMMEWIALNGQIPTVGFFYASYHSFPLSHLLAAQTSIVTSLGTKASIAASILFFESFSIIFIFLLVRRFYSAEIGLLSAFLLGIAAQHIMTGFLSTPQTFGIALCPLILYLLYKSTKEYATTYTGILVLLFIAMPFIHHLSSMMLFIMLISICLADRVLLKIQDIKRESSFHLSTCLLCGVIVIAHIMHSIIFETSIESFQDWLTGGLVVPLTLGIQPTHFEHIWDSLGLVLLMLLAILGGLYVLRDKRFGLFALAVAGALFLAFGLLSTLAGLEPILAGYRWIAWAHVLMAILAGVGFGLIATRKTKVIKVIFVIILSLVLSTSMLTTYGSNDSSATEVNIGSKAPAMAFKESEIQAFGTLTTILGPEQELMTDWLPRGTYFNRPETIDIYHRMPYGAKLFLDKDISHIPNSTVVIIRDRIRREPFYVSRSWKEWAIYTILDYDPRELLDTSASFNKVYSVGTVYAYTKS